MVRVLITGGGTGGHIYPALAIIRALQDRLPQVELLYVGSKRGMESELVVREGIAFRGITVQGLIGKRVLNVIAGIGRAAWGTGEALAAVSSFRPNVVVGTGGYVSGPVVLAAIMMRVPVFLQEQNVIPGVTNRILSRWVDVVAVPFPESKRYFPPNTSILVAGNPVRKEIITRTKAEGLRGLGLREGKKTLLIFGGSRGARRVVEAAIGILPEVLEDGNIQVIFATGKEYYQEAVKRLVEMGISEEKNGNIILMPYLYQMADALAAADLVISRAGAMTLAEVTARGIPSILIPSPNVAHNHQEANARVLEKAGAAIVILEKDLTTQSLKHVVLGLLNDAGKLASMQAKARELGQPESTELMVEKILEIAQ